MATQQSDVAVNYANQVQNLVQQLTNIRSQVANIIAVNTVTPLGNLWNKLNTTPLLNDGNLGTADTQGTPVLADYIDPRVYPTINRTVKASDLANGLQALVDLNTFFQGTAVAANGARPANLNALGM